jgi:hypothetical protein
MERFSLCLPEIIGRKVILHIEILSKYPNISGRHNAKREL